MGGCAVSRGTGEGGALVDVEGGAARFIYGEIFEEEVGCVCLGFVSIIGDDWEWNNESNLQPRPPPPPFGG